MEGMKMRDELKEQVAQDPMTLPKNAPGLVLENGRVRVLHALYRAGEKTTMHSHPDHVLHIVKGGTIRLVYPSGKEETMDLESGKTIFMDAQSHEVTNLSDSDIDLIVIELK
jgi:quercetin dioxygenase-like cupin family protein